MNFSWKRLLAIAGFVLLVILLAYGLYALFFRGTQPETPPTTTTPGSTGGLPTVQPGQPTVNEPGGTTGLPTSPTQTEPSPVASGGITVATPVVPNNAAGATADGQSVLFYQPNDGHFYRVTADGQTQTLTDEVFFNVEDVTWSPNRERAILEYPDGSNVVYNFQTQRQVTLPKHWEEFSFNASGDQIAFKSSGVDRASRWLGVATADGGQAQAVQALGDNGSRVSVDWSPNRQVVATYRESTSEDQQEVYFVGLNGENFRSLTVPGLAFQGQWTPDGSRMLFSVTSAASGYKPSLWIVDASGEAIGQNRYSLGLNTWADKCAFQGTSSVICAVPQTLADGSGLAPGLSSTIPSDLYRINLTTGERALIARPDTNIAVKDIFLAEDNRSVFVQDGPSGRIYKIAL